MEKKIVTTQDLIDRLVSLGKPQAQIEILITTDGIDGQWIDPNCFDFSVKCAKEDDVEIVILQCYR